MNTTCSDKRSELRGLRGYWNNLLKQREKKSAGSLLDASIPLDEIPKGQTILKPTKAKPKEVQNIEEVDEAVENWDEWMKEVENKNITQRPHVDDAHEAFKSHIAELYKMFELVECKSALNHFSRQYRIEGVEGYGPERFLLASKSSILTFLRDNPNIKVQLALHCTMSRTDLKTGEVEYVPAHFVSKTEINFQGGDVEDLYKTMKDKILESLATYQQRGSNWVFDSVEELTVHTVKYEPLSGSSYIPLPKELAYKYAIINMQNRDNECFKWCITRALNPVEKNPSRITKILRLQAEKLNWEGLKFPMELKDIHRFEALNGVAVNVFGYEKVVYPLRVSNKMYKDHVNLLLISRGEKKHYCLIKSMSRLLSSQVSKKKEEKHFCSRCLNAFGTQKLLDKHLQLCGDNEAVRIKMPEEGESMSFKNNHRKMDMPFVIYADFESIMRPFHSTQSNPEKPYTEKKMAHIPVSFYYYVKCSFDDKFSKVVEYTAKSEDEDVSQIFVDRLEQEVNSIYKDHPPKKMIFTERDSAIYEKSTSC